MYVAKEKVIFHQYFDNGKMKRFGVWIVAHSLYSPDLASADCYLIPNPKNFVFCDWFGSNKEFIEAVDRFFATLKIPMTMSFQKVLPNICIKIVGGPSCWYQIIFSLKSIRASVNQFLESPNRIHDAMHSTKYFCKFSYVQVCKLWNIVDLEPKYLGKSFCSRHKISQDFL